MDRKWTEKEPKQHRGNTNGKLIPHPKTAKSQHFLTKKAQNSIFLTKKFAQTKIMLYLCALIDKTR